MPKIPMGLEEGLKNLGFYTKRLKDNPGVYFFKNDKDQILYIGKAKRLKKRVKSYLRWDNLPVRKQRMIAQLATVEVSLTTTETEALLLEVNLIKKHRPPYNILLKDDKSFPYIQLTGGHMYPRLKIYRGTRKDPGEYFGPFASGTAVNETYETLQKVFLLRTCSDNIFLYRTRPCLLYDIKRCSAPCVEKISEKKYTHLLKDVKKFFKGKTKSLQENLAKEMIEASRQRHYEKAAAFRDRIASLTKIQEHQAINLPSSTQNLHIHALSRQHNKVCIQVAFYQAGQHFGSRSYFPIQIHEDMTNEEVFSAFLMQFYERHQPPKHILTSIEPMFKQLAEEALTESTKFKVDISVPKSGVKKQALDLVLKNAIYALQEHLKEKTFYQKALIELQNLLNMDKAILRIEAYDNSHLMGTHPYGVMIVADDQGFKKSAYRKFHIKDPSVKTNDDYAMMRHVIQRRFKFSGEKKEGEEALPNVILIDGGLGQLGVVRSFFKEISPKFQAPRILAIAKGPKRNAGEETFYFDTGEVLKLPKDSSLLFFLQRLRDESHRFAITTHRQKRDKDIKKSILDSIPGIGAKRKKALLLHFGSAKGVMNAAAIDLKAVEGVSKFMAQAIYDYFHES